MLVFVRHSLADLLRYLIVVLSRLETLYLLAIVAANYLAATLGPTWTPVIGFLFIGFDLTARDRLHESWQHRGLFARMASLILLGSAISYTINRDVQPIAIASAVAFLLSATADALVYQVLARWPWSYRANASNAVSALVDSVAFPTLAFGAFLPWIVVGQLVAKVVGGALWSVVLARRQQTQVFS